MRTTALNASGRNAWGLTVAALLVAAALSPAPAAAQTPPESDTSERTVLLCDEPQREAVWEDRWVIDGDSITFMRGDKEAGKTRFESLPNYLRATLEGAEIWINRYTLTAYIAEKNDQGLMLTRTLDCRILDRQL